MAKNEEPQPTFGERLKAYWQKVKGWFTRAKESEAAEKAGEMAGKAWTKTKEGAGKAWDKTKDVAEDVKDWGEEKIEDIRQRDEDEEKKKDE